MKRYLPLHPYLSLIFLPLQRSSQFDDHFHECYYTISIWHLAMENTALICMFSNFI